MSLPADAQFWLQRALGLGRRGWASLRTRGVAASGQRLLAHFRPSPVPAIPLYTPAAAAFSPFLLATSVQPLASLVIPVYGAWTHSLACLRALAEHPPRTPFEVIVVDDASPDDSLRFLQQIDGIRLHIRKQNGGFISACNEGAALARGQYLIFLNNDTVPQPGWLEALLETFTQQPDAGLVGAKLVYPDGRLQEAGGVIFADGSGWNYGRFDDPMHCQYNYLRDADYLSGAAIAISRALFMQLGGFDPCYAPAYYEDTDLAFKVRNAGLRVLYQPTAVVVHNEGSSAGTDPGRGMKAAQRRNQPVFAQRWHAELAAHLPAHTVPTPASVHRKQPQILIIDAQTPQPDRDSGSLRAFELMRLLIEEGAHVVFWPANQRADGQYTQALQTMGVECWHAACAPRLPVWLRQHGARFQTVMVSRHYVASECLPLVRKYAPQARVLFDTVDLHHLREHRAAELRGDAVALRAAAQTRRQELELIDQADITLVVSAVERQLLAREKPDKQVDILSNLHRLHAAGPGFAQRRDLLFIGGFRHPPNVDAMHWFIDAVFPLLRAAQPEIQLHCIGADVPASIAGLAQRAGVHVHGHVPNVQPWLDHCRVSVAPLRFGAGVKGKINQAMAHGLPVVATSCAVEAMHLRDGDDVLVADDSATFAHAVLRLYADGALWERLSRRGRENIARHFSIDAARPHIRRIFFP